jgi:hypothetical protein
MTAKHSATPWAVEESFWCGHDDCRHGHVEIFVNDANGFPVHRWTCDGHGIDDARANARLIACAANCHDDLLAAARLMASTLQGFTSEELSKRVTEIHGPSFDEAQESLWAAIAKAERPFDPQAGVATVPMDAI